MGDYNSVNENDNRDSRFRDYYLNNGNTEEASREYERIVADMKRKSDEANGLQIAGLVFGILSIITCCCYGVFGLIFSVMGIIFSACGNRKSTHGIGIGGLIVSVIGCIISVLFIVYLVFAAITFMRNVPESFDFNNIEQLQEMVEQMLQQLQSGQLQ